MTAVVDQRRTNGTGGQGRTVPADTNAEASLLGAMLLHRDAIDAATEHCTADDFYAPAHAHIFDAIVRLHSHGQPADPVTVSDDLRRQGLLEQAGGPNAIVGLQTVTPATGNAERYALIVSELALLRRFIASAGALIGDAYDTPEDVDAFLNQAEATVFDLAHRQGHDVVTPVRDLLGGALDRVEALFNRSTDVTGLPTGFTDLDRQLCGLQPSNLIIVGARPAAGKTSFALNIVAHAAQATRRPILFFSLEMSQLEISMRLISAEARVDSTRLRSGRLVESDWPKLSHAVGKIADSPIFIDDNPTVTALDIRRLARRLKAKEGDLGLVVVDYIQLMTGRSKAENRQVEVSEISRGLKILARELECPVIALSQLSRNLESRADKRPTLADLRESGSLEQDADVVIFLYRDELYNKDSNERGIAEVIISKHRSGPTGMTKLAFLDQYTRFANMARI